MDQTRIYRQLFLLADIVLLALAGFLFSKIILAALVPAAETPFVNQERVIQTRPAEKEARGSDTSVIMSRNLFGSRTLAPSASPVEISEEDLESLPESTLPLKLLGTVVQVSGKRSFAIIEDTGSRDQGIHFVGDEIREGTKITSITRNRVVLLRNGREEILEKAEDQDAQVTRAPVTERPARASVMRSATENESIAVRRVGDNSFVMDRREVEGVLQDFNKLLTQVRVVPHFADGNPDGFKIFNIRPGSLFASLGMVNGDIIKRVNGLDITGPEQALQMFQQLRDESQVTVDLVRFRKNLTLNYEIR